MLTSSGKSPRTWPKNIARSRRFIFISRSAVLSSTVTTYSRPGEATTARSDFASVLGLVQWAIANNIRFTGCRPDIRNGVRGAYATSDCNAGDNLVAVPLESSLVVRPDERCPFPEFIPQDVWSSLPWYSQLACKLLHERSLGPTSRFADYLPALPRHVDLPALWPPELVRRLQYPYLEQQILDEQEEWSRLYGTLRRHLDGRGLSREDLFWAIACVRSRTFAGPHLPTPAAIKVLAGAVGAAVTAAATTFATATNSIVATTAAAAAAAAAEPGPLLATLLPAALVGLSVPALWQAIEARRASEMEPGTVLYALCPFIDMFNHDSRAQSECLFTPWQGEFRVAAGEAIRRGQQVLISYGNQSNDALLQRYGFVQLHGNPHDRYVLENLRPKLEQLLAQEAGIAVEDVWAATRGFDSALQADALQQVILTADGAPQRTLQAVSAMLGAVASRQAAGAAERPLPSAAALLATVCAQRQGEMRAADSCSGDGNVCSRLEEDEAALRQLEVWQAWKVAVVEQRTTPHIEKSVEGPAVEMRGDARVEVLETAKGSVANAEAGTGVAGVALAVDGGEFPSLPLPVEPEQLLPPQELAAFGNNVERYRTVLTFRIAKMRVLRAASIKQG